MQDRLAIIKNAAAAVHASLGDQIADYTVRMAAAMASAGRVISARRAVIISRNIALVHAALHPDNACSVRGQGLADSSWLALCNSLPFTASALAFVITYGFVGKPSVKAAKVLMATKLVAALAGSGVWMNDLAPFVIDMKLCGALSPHCTRKMGE